MDYDKKLNRRDPDFVAPMAVVDMSARAAENPDTVVTVENFTAWENEHGALPAGATLLVGASRVQNASGGPVACSLRGSDGAKTDGPSLESEPRQQGFEGSGAGVVLKKRRARSNAPSQPV